MKVYFRWLWKLLALSAGINMVIELASRKSLLNLGSYIGNSFFIFMLNTLIIFLPFTIMFITRRKAFACILITFLWIFMGIVNGILLIFRTTPFTAADLRLVKYAISLATVYFTWMQIILMVCAGVLAFILLVGVWKKAPVSQEKNQAESWIGNHFFKYCTGTWYYKRSHEVRTGSGSFWQHRTRLSIIRIPILFFQFRI
jgi:hypothetical protein